MKELNNNTKTIIVFVLLFFIWFIYSSLTSEVLNEKQIINTLHDYERQGELMDQPYIPTGGR